MQAQPVIVIHGGCGGFEGGHASYTEYGQHLRPIVESAHAVLMDKGARAAVLTAVMALEDDPLFNAGTGAKLQADGEARLSAALIDSASKIFSGVINIRRVRHPIEVAERLSHQQNHVLSGQQAQQFARQQGMADYDPVVAHRRVEYEQQLAGRHGTVGAVAVDRNGMLCAGTSTGGVGREYPGRVGDSPTIAGTYASATAAVSCTGTGEEIVNLAVAPRIVDRVDNGLELVLATAHIEEQARELGYQFGLISVDQQGHYSVAATEGIVTLYAVYQNGRVGCFIE